MYASGPAHIGVDVGGVIVMARTNGRPDAGKVAAKVRPADGGRIRPGGAVSSAPIAAQIRPRSADRALRRGFPPDRRCVLISTGCSGEWRNGRRARFRSVSWKRGEGSTPFSPTLVETDETAPGRRESATGGRSRRVGRFDEIRTGIPSPRNPAPEFRARCAPA